MRNAGGLKAAEKEQEDSILRRSLERFTVFTVKSADTDDRVIGLFHRKTEVLSPLPGVMTRRWKLFKNTFSFGSVLWDKSHQPPEPDHTEGTISQKPGVPDKVLSFFLEDAGKQRKSAKTAFISF